jgi:hypothetical protein
MERMFLRSSLIFEPGILANDSVFGLQFSLLCDFWSTKFLKLGKLQGIGLPIR